MFTRCPGCKTVHPLNAALLAQGNGLYRCGECNKVSNALQILFDFPPETDDNPSSAGSASRQPPVLGGASDQDASLEAEVTEEEAQLLRAAGFTDLHGTPKSGRNFWLIGVIVLGIVTLVNVFVISKDELIAQPTVRSALESMGVVDPVPEHVYQNLELLHLASSEMHSHPTLDETLILNATIVNRADQTQAFPSLQITLFDAQNQPLAMRIFAPDEYLQSNNGPGDGMAPGAYLPVIMELLDPGQHAVGFEMKFL